MKKNLSLAALLAAIVVSVTIAACDLGNGRLRYSVQVNNQAAGLTIANTDTVELYILNLEYSEDANNRGLILIADGDRTHRGRILNNAGWYSVKSDLAVTNDVNNGSYSGFQIRIGQLRVNETEYDFPVDGNQGHGVMFGYPTNIWGSSWDIYPDNFSGITMTDSVYSLKTILTVEPEILDGNGNLADDPYQYIKIEGRINE
ncbi:MAG: hypothetical protein LBQ61_07165 [Spirochaetales bacterium]|jgi:hypothetical protein|nr:hypothetical protein [Spirochaetales bacterium]